MKSIFERYNLFVTSSPNVVFWPVCFTVIGFFVYAGGGEIGFWQVLSPEHHALSIALVVLLYIGTAALMIAIPERVPLILESPIISFAFSIAFLLILGPLLLAFFAIVSIALKMLMLLCIPCAVIIWLHEVVFDKNPRLTAAFVLWLTAIPLLWWLADAFKIDIAFGTLITFWLGVVGTAVLVITRGVLRNKLNMREDAEALFSYILIPFGIACVGIAGWIAGFFIA